MGSKRKGTVWSLPEKFKTVPEVYHAQRRAHTATDYLEDVLKYVDPDKSRVAAIKQAFRSLKTTMLHLRPVYHWREDRIRAHVFLCMLAYYVEWHLRRDLRPLLFHDEQREEAERQRESIVRPAPRSEAAVRKERERRTEDGLPVQSLRCLLRDLATICRNTVRWRSSSVAFERMTLPTDSQRRALELLGVALEPAR